jgi:exonuclease SbcC
MIIHSIEAHNVLKYAKLEINDLPKEGVIAISGYNESGKSSIGETICFALYGRTFSLGEDELDKIIRWGESDCSVTLRFSNYNAEVGADEDYVITRMLDCDGNHSARLSKVFNEEPPIARGVESVEEALYELNMMEFEEFIESFYLAQREITTPHPHSYALKTMAGIATMEYCDGSINEDIRETLDVCDELNRRIAQLQEEIVEMEIDQDRLDSLTAQHDQALSEKNQLDDDIANYQNAVEQYNEAAPQLKQHQGKKGRAGLWRFLSFLLAVVAGGLWWVLVKMPDQPIQAEVINQLQTHIPQFLPQHYPYLLYAAGVFAVLFLFFWISISSHKGHMKRLSESGVELADKMRALDQTRNSETTDELREIAINKIHKSTMSSQQLAEVTEADISEMSQQQEQLAETISTLSAELATERERVNRANELQSKMDTIQEQIDEKTERNHIRELATELLMGASRHLSKRFNHIIRDHVGKTLPLFTENRYEHLQIDDDLTVRVFSNEKHDFMDLDEISSGTQRQIMLAVRLALSQEMVSRKVQSHQFLILDEPFAFFDEERTQKSLSVLPQLSDDLPQIWIIAQSFPENMEFEHVIHCEREALEKTG